VKQYIRWFAMFEHFRQHAVRLYSCVLSRLSFVLMADGVCCSGSAKWIALQFLKARCAHCLLCTPSVFYNLSFFFPFLWMFWGQRLDRFSRYIWHQHLTIIVVQHRMMWRSLWNENTFLKSKGLSKSNHLKSKEVSTLPPPKVD